METLVNELLTSRKQRSITDGRIRSLNCAHFNTVAAVVNTLNELENAESSMYLRHDNALLEMHRIAQRQFHWQRGFANLPELCFTA
jgi:hypothetical protein